jgi:hypothetical protein
MRLGPAVTSAAEPGNGQNGPKTAGSGGNPNPCGCLDFRIGSPYTGPAFKLSVRRMTDRRRGKRGSFRQVAGASLQVRAAPRPLCFSRMTVWASPLG